MGYFHRAERGGEIIAGLIYNPINDEIFWGEKGLGAYWNNRRLRVSARNELADCLIATGIPFAGAPKAGFTAQLEAVMPKVAGIRRFGAAALDLAYVAAGRYDAYWETGVHPWDVAAGVLLVKESGGFVDGFKEGENPITSRGIIATNSGIHDKLVPLLRKA